jgi:prophage regulatory protein
MNENLGLDNQLKDDYSFQSRGPIENRFLRIAEVCELVGLKKTKLYSLIKDGDFPSPMKFGSSSVWAGKEVRRWQEGKVRLKTMRELI